MNQKLTPSLMSLKLALKEAKIVSPPDVLKRQEDVNEQLALKLIDSMRKQYTKPSPFGIWMVEPVQLGYTEMAAADVR